MTSDASEGSSDPAPQRGAAARSDFEQRRARREKLGMMRTIVPMTAACFILVMFAQVFLGDIFVLTTSSMEPLAAGRHGGADSVLLSRLHTACGQHDRWSVLLFNYPNNRRVNYLKRLVGLGGEQLLIRGGDLYLIDPSFDGSVEEAYARGLLSVLRKPAPLLAQLLDGLPVISEAEWADLDQSLWQRHFRIAEGNNDSWHLADGSAHLKTKARAQVQVLRPLTDALFDTLHPASVTQVPRKVAGGENPISDLSLVVRVQPQNEGGAVILSIDDGPAGLRLEAFLGIGDTKTALPLDHQDRSRLVVGDIVMGTSDFRLAVGQWTEIRFESIDDRMSLFVDNELVLARDFHHPPCPAGGTSNSQPSQVGLGGQNLSCRFQPVALRRDIHYTQDGQSRFNIPVNHLVFLGDNTASSADSRAWKRVAIERNSDGAILYGDAQGSPAGNSSLQFQNPFQNPNGSWTFCDALGRYHPFDAIGEWRALASWRTPYISEAEVLGRAIAVIWPLDRCTWLR